MSMTASGYIHSVAGPRLAATPPDCDPHRPPQFNEDNRSCHCSCTRDSDSISVVDTSTYSDANSDTEDTEVSVSQEDLAASINSFNSMDSIVLSHVSHGQPYHSDTFLTNLHQRLTTAPTELADLGTADWRDIVPMLARQHRCAWFQHHDVRHTPEVMYTYLTQAVLRRSLSQDSMVVEWPGDNQSMASSSTLSITSSTSSGLLISTGGCFSYRDAPPEPNALGMESAAMTGYGVGNSCRHDQH